MRKPKAVKFRELFSPRHAHKSSRENGAYQLRDQTQVFTMHVPRSREF